MIKGGTVASFVFRSHFTWVCFASRVVEQNTLWIGKCHSPKNQSSEVQDWMSQRKMPSSNVKWQEKDQEQKKITTLVQVKDQS